jgi:hypothetical protein
MSEANEITSIMEKREESPVSPNKECGNGSAEPRGTRAVRRRRRVRKFVITGRCTGVAGGSQLLATAPQKDLLSRDFKTQPCGARKTFASGGSGLMLLSRNRKSGRSA